MAAPVKELYGLLVLYVIKVLCVVCACMYVGTHFYSFIFFIV